MAKKEKDVQVDPNLEIKERILSLVNSFSPDDDSLWTDEGLPNPEIVCEQIGEPLVDAEVAVQWIAWAAPAVNRQTAVATEAATKESTQVVAPVAAQATVSVEEIVAESDDPIEALKSQLAILHADRKGLQDRIDAITFRLDKLINEKEAAGTSNFADSLAHYRASQERERLARAEKIAFVRENGSVLKDILKTKSNLDMALGAKKRR